MRTDRPASCFAVLVWVALAAPAFGQVVTEFPIPSGGNPQYITAGPDGNLWFAVTGTHRIGRITTAGVVTEFPTPTPLSEPFDIAVGSDGNLWFTEITANKIGRITTAGVITEFPIPTASSGPFGIAAGPDGNLWFVESDANKIGRMTTAGVVTGEFPIPTAGDAYRITAGPDGNLWFTEQSGSRVARITTAGVITEFPTTTANSEPQGIVKGQDGNLWFTEGAAAKIGRITPAGAITEFPVTTGGSFPEGIALGPEGSLWFVETSANKVCRITTAGGVTEFPVTTAGANPVGIAAGADGALWFTEFSKSAIGRVTVAALTPRPMDVDARSVAGSSSDANGVLEPGETVQVAPTWLNTLAATPQSFTGTASGIGGPPGPAYAIGDPSANYGSIAAGQQKDCYSQSTDCYLMTVSGSRPADHWDADFTETLTASGIAKVWKLHLGDSFVDVPRSHGFYRFIETLIHAGVTGGCLTGSFCPDGSVTRAQMAVFLLKGRLGINHVPPPATGTVFGDVHPGDFAADWIEELAGYQITAGCGGGNYCPSQEVTRAQMAVFLLKAEHGWAYAPPACTHVFADVDCPSQYADWIEQLAAEGVTAGCGNGKYCPDDINIRGQMAVFIVKTFGLELYGP